MAISHKWVLLKLNTVKKLLCFLTVVFIIFTFFDCVCVCHRTKWKHLSLSLIFLHHWQRLLTFWCWIHTCQVCVWVSLLFLLFHLHFKFSTFDYFHLFLPVCVCVRVRVLSIADFDHHLCRWSLFFFGFFVHHICKFHGSLRLMTFDLLTLQPVRSRMCVCVCVFSIPNCLFPTVSTLCFHGKDLSLREYECVCVVHLSLSLNTKLCLWTAFIHPRKHSILSILWL